MTDLILSDEDIWGTAPAQDSGSSADKPLLSDEDIWGTPATPATPKNPRNTLNADNPPGMPKRIYAPHAKVNGQTYYRDGNNEVRTWDKSGKSPGDVITDPAITGQVPQHDMWEIHSNRGIGDGITSALQSYPVVGPALGLAAKIGQTGYDTYNEIAGTPEDTFAGMKQASLRPDKSSAVEDLSSSVNVLNTARLGNELINLDAKIQQVGKGKGKAAYLLRDQLPALQKQRDDVFSQLLAAGGQNFEQNPVFAAIRDPKVPGTPIQKTVAAFRQDPYGAARSWALQSAAVSAPSVVGGIGGGIIGGPVGSALGAGAGSVWVEMGSGILDGIQKRGGNVNNPAGMRAIWDRDKDQIIREATIGGLIVGGADALSGGLSSKVAAMGGKGVIRNTAKELGGTIIEAIGGGSGEALKQIERDGKITDLQSILDEVGGEFTSGAVQTGAQIGWNAVTGKPNEDTPTSGTLNDMAGPLAGTPVTILSKTPDGKGWNIRLPDGRETIAGLQTVTTGAPPRVEPRLQTPPDSPQGQQTESPAQSAPQASGPIPGPGNAPPPGQAPMAPRYGPIRNAAQQPVAPPPAAAPAAPAAPMASTAPKPSNQKNNSLAIWDSPDGSMEIRLSNIPPRMVDGLWHVIATGPDSSVVSVPMDELKPWGAQFPDQNDGSVEGATPPQMRPATPAETAAIEGADQTQAPQAAPARQPITPAPMAPRAPKQDIQAPQAAPVPPRQPVTPAPMAPRAGPAAPAPEVAQAEAEAPAVEAPAVEAVAAPEPKDPPKRAAIPRRDMTDDTAVTASGRDVPVKYAVVEASDLVASQLDDGGSNPYYPAELQPRDRARAVSQRQVQDIATKLDPRLLDKSPRASDGSPIIADDGTVESGNGRVLAIRRAYKQNGEPAKRYREHLAAQGYPVGGIREPVLVRVRQGEMDPEDRQAFTREANERDTLGMSSTERAMADAAAMPDSVISQYRGGDVQGTGNREFVKAFILNVVGKNDQANLVAADGSLSQEAIRRVEAALLAKAYGDAELVASLTESPDTNIKVIGGALMDVAPAWAQMRAEAASGEIDSDADQTARLLDAVRLVQRARRENMALGLLVGQNDIFSGKSVHPIAEAFLRLMFRNTNVWSLPVGREKLAASLQFYVEEERKTSSGTDLLGETAAKPDAILALARKKQDRTDDKPDQAGFDLAQRPHADTGKGVGAPGQRGESPVAPRNEDAGRPETAATDKPEVKAAVPSKTEQIPDETSLVFEPVAEKPSKKPDNAAVKTEEVLPRANSVKPKAKSVSEPDAKITDFGEKIAGARKDAVRDIVKSLEEDVDLEVEPLSKTFPQPNYEKLADAGVERKALALVALMRAEIPTKPKKAYKAKGWAEGVKALREFAQNLLSGKHSAGYVMDKLRQSSRLSTLADTAEILSGLDAKHLPFAAQFAVKSGPYYQFMGEKFDRPTMRYYLQDDRGRMTDIKGASVDAIRMEATQFIRERAEAQEAQGPSERRTPLALHQDRKSKEIFIGFKGLRDVIRLKAGFLNTKDARAYMTEHAAELQAKIDELRKGPEERRAANMPRQGPSRRAGDVSPEQFQEAFGFRGVQFGNWVESDRRQSDLNEAFDALMDMADVIGVPSKALSLGGTLGLAFGARGKSKYAAHYEPGQIVINLTKMSGAGSLAHEWLHAIDNYFAKKDQSIQGSAGTYISEQAKSKGGTREALFSAWKAVQKSITGGTFSKRSGEYDSARSKPYFNTIIEKAARSFERYIHDRLNEQGATNDYLANINTEGGAYPTEKEMVEQGIRKAYDDLFATMEATQTEDGNVILGNTGHAANGKLPPTAFVVSKKQIQELNVKVQALARQMFGHSLRIDVMEKLPSFVPKDFIAAYNPAQRAAYLSLKAAHDWAFNVGHEGYHHLRETGAVTEAEHRILFEQAKKQNPEGLSDSRIESYRREYQEKYGLTDQQFIYRIQEEAVADLLGEYVDGRETGNPKADGVLAKIRDFIEALFRLMEGAGWDMPAKLTKGSTAEGILSDIYEGGRRDAAARDVAGQTDLAAHTLGMAERDITKTEAFRKWFGDSKVVDENGKPLVVYHGTAADFTAFEKGKIGDIFGVDKEGFFFTNNIGVKDVSSADSYADHAAMVTGGAANIMPAYVSLQNPLIIDSAKQDFDGRGAVDYLESVIGMDNAIGQAHDGGHDGLMVIDRSMIIGASRGLPGSPEYIVVAFEPAQIKSVFNSGAFDPNNPAILGMAPADDGGRRGSTAPVMAPSELAVTAEDKKKLDTIAGNINLSYIKTTDEAVKVMRAVADQAEGFMGARRGVVSHEQTAQLATELGISYSELMKRRQGQAFNAHELFAARALLLKSAERVAKLAKSARTTLSLSELAEFQSALTRHAAIQEQVSGAVSEAGRALNQQRMMAKSNYVKALNAIIEDAQRKKKTGPEAIREIADMVSALDDPAKIGKFTHDLFKITIWDMLREIWINALLSGLRTHATNILSNTLVALYQVPETALASVIGRFHSGDRVEAGEALARLNGLLEGVKEGLQAAVQVIKTDEPPDRTAKMDQPRKKAVPGVIGRIVRVPGTALMAADEVFKAVNTRAEINALATRMAMKEGLDGQALVDRIAELRNMPTMAMQDAAHEAALYNTFQNRLGPAGRWMMQGREMIPGAWIIMPFLKTPLNILKYAIERTPFGLVLGDVRRNLKGENGNVARDTQMARLALGSAISLSVVSLAMSGMISGGGPGDDEEKNVLRATGWQPYSFKIGDTWYSYQRMDPFGFQIGIVADMVELNEAMDETEASKIGAMVVSAFAENVLNKTYLSGASELLKAVTDPARYGESYVRGLAGTLIPTGVAHFAQTLDPVQRDARTALDRIKSRVPWMSQSLPPRRNIFGEEIRYTGSLGPDLVSPIFSSTEVDNPIAKAMKDANYFPSMPSRRVNNHLLTPEQYDAYTEDAGKEAVRHLTIKVAGSGWERRSADSKAKVIEQAYSDARERGRKHIKKRWPELKKKAVSGN